MADLLYLLDLVLDHLQPAALVANDRQMACIRFHIRVHHGLSQVLQEDVQRLKKLLPLDGEQLQNSRSLNESFELGENIDHLPWIAQVMVQLGLESGGDSFINWLKDLLKVLQSPVPFGLTQRGCIKNVEI